MTDFDHDAILAEQGQRAKPAVWAGYKGQHTESGVSGGEMKTSEWRIWSREEYEAELDAALAHPVDLSGVNMPARLRLMARRLESILRNDPEAPVLVRDVKTLRWLADNLEANAPSAPPSGHEGATLSARLLNAAERICDGLEPREDVAALLVEAGKELGALEAVVEDAKRVFADKAAETLALRRKAEQGDPEAVRAALRRVLERGREDVVLEIARVRQNERRHMDQATTVAADRIIAAIARRVS